MEIRGVRFIKKAFVLKDKGLFVLRPPENLVVPLISGQTTNSTRVISVGDDVKEGTLLATPNGRYGSYVYSPCSGKVAGIVKKLNAMGNMCEHVIISRNNSDEKAYLEPLNIDKLSVELLLKRLYESGLVDNYAPFEPTYKKYLLKYRIKTLIINCTEDDPYLASKTTMLEEFMSQIVEGAKYFKAVCQAEKIVFLFSRNQKHVARKVLNQIKALHAQKEIAIKFVPNVYPLSNSRLVAYYFTGKMVSEKERSSKVNIIVESPNNCYDFYNAVSTGKQAFERIVTVAGNNSLRKANYIIKNGTSLRHVLEVSSNGNVNPQNMVIYGGVMTGIAQETLDISTSLTASCILFLDDDEYANDKETPCINCGKCLAVCPVRLNVRQLDQAFINRDFVKAQKLGCTACISCGACSYVCPAKRYLAQRVSFMKDLQLGKRIKNPNSSEYEVVEGEDVEMERLDELKTVVHADVKYTSGDQIENVEDMLKTLQDHAGGNK